MSIQLNQSTGVNAAFSQARQANQGGGRRYFLPFLPICRFELSADDMLVPLPYFYLIDSEIAWKIYAIRGVLFTTQEFHNF